MGNWLVGAVKARGVDGMADAAGGPMLPALRSFRTYVALSRYNLQNYQPTYLPTLAASAASSRATYLPTLPPHRDAGKTPTFGSSV